MNGISVGFALARVHARHAARPTASDWRRLDAARTASQYLNYARQTGLRRWLHTVTEEETQANSELRLRTAYRHHVAEVAGWLPADSAPSARLIAELPDLPTLDHLYRGGTPQPWMSDDPRLAEALETPPVQPPYATWLARWNDLWPGPRRSLLSGRIGTALRGIVTSGEAPRVAQRLHWAFRTHTLHAAGVYAYLGLVLDDLRLLAGGLARRRPGESRHEEAA